MEALKRSDGSYSNDPDAGGSTPASAGAITLLHTLGVDADDKTIQWMFRRCRAIGGFVAMELSPIPDLLSTAVALHAFGVNGVGVDKIRQPCLDFIDSLWDVAGGFCGNWLDEVVDCEYTYYGLLALGNL